MKLKTPSPENRPSIVAALKDTFTNRRTIILEKAVAGQILQQYPRLKDFNGEMVSFNEHIYIDVIALLM